jgi:hypothetical protein
VIVGEVSLAAGNTDLAAPLKGMGPFGSGNSGADGRWRRTSVRWWNGSSVAGLGAARSRDGRCSRCRCCARRGMEIFPSAMAGRADGVHCVHAFKADGTVRW